MSGMVQNVITRRTFTFSSVGTTGSLEIPLVRALDITDAKSIDLVVRLHSATIGTGATLVVKAYAISLTSDEPNVDFLVQPSAALATITFTATPTVPQLALAALTTPFGHMIRVTVTGTQPAGVQTITAVLSIDLVIRDN